MLGSSCAVPHPRHVAGAATDHWQCDHLRLIIRVQLLDLEKQKRRVDYDISINITDSAITILSTQQTGSQQLQ
jgi:hypothetical protein